MKVQIKSRSEYQNRTIVILSVMGINPVHTDFLVPAVNLKVFVLACEKTPVEIVLSGEDSLLTHLVEPQSFDIFRTNTINDAAGQHRS